MNYFVTVGGITIFNNLSKDKAIEAAINNNQSNTGIGHFKMKNGKKVYTLLPLHFYLD